MTSIKIVYPRLHFLITCYGVTGNGVLLDLEAHHGLEQRWATNFKVVDGFGYELVIFYVLVACMSFSE